MKEEKSMSADCPATEESESNEEIHSQLKYSLGVGFVALGTILGISDFVSTRYMSISIKFGLYLLFLILLAGSLGLLLNILMHGFSLVKELERIRPGMIFFSKKSFDTGMIGIFLGLAVYLPFFSFYAFILSFLDSPYLTNIVIPIFPIFWSIIILRVVYGSFIPQLPKSLEFIRYQNIKRKTREISYILFALLVFAISAWGTELVVLYSYDITIDKEFYINNGENVCVVTVRVCGFASVDDPEQISVWVYSDKWERKYLSQIEKGYYFTSFSVEDFKKGVHYIEVSCLGTRTLFTKRELLLIDDCS